MACDDIEHLDDDDTISASILELNGSMNPYLTTPFLLPNFMKKIANWWIVVCYENGYWCVVTSWSSFGITSLISWLCYNYWAHHPCSVDNQYLSLIHWKSRIIKNYPWNELAADLSEVWAYHFLLVLSWRFTELTLTVVLHAGLSLL